MVTIIEIMTIIIIIITDNNDDHYNAACYSLARRLTGDTLII